MWQQQTEILNKPSHILEKIGGSEVGAINYLVLNCSSKDFIPFYIRVCKFLGLENFIAVYDTDLHDGKNENQINTAKKSTEDVTKDAD